MTTHRIGFTYPPKFAGIMDGSIRQTIRFGRSRPVYQGDELLLLAGLPYRSKWLWRKYEIAKEAIDIVAKRRFYTTEDLDLVPLWTHWTSVYADELARLDGIVPATGVELRHVLERLGVDLDAGAHGQIIRW